MRWRFWRRDERPVRDLPADTGLRWEPGVGPVHTAPADDRDEAHGRSARAPAFSGASPQPGEVPLYERPPVDDPLQQEHEVDAAFARLVADAVVSLVTPLVAGDAVAFGSARAALQAQLAGATEDQQGLAAVVALVPLSVRLPLLAGVAGEVDEDALAREELLAYAPLVAGRAEPLRARFAADVQPELVRFSAYFACGHPDAEPDHERLFSAPAADQVVASAVLLAQTCLDGASGPEALRAEISASFPPAA